jgi:RimJ/RimL family protein N-acetyltransferase
VLAAPSNNNNNKRYLSRKEAVMTTALRNTEISTTLTATPTLGDVRHWWETRQADPDSITVFTDDSPRNFMELLNRVNTKEYLFYLAHQGDTVVGAMWLHDIVWDENGTPRAGWLGTYVLPEHRGRRTTQEMWTLIYEALTALGVQSLHIASHHANTRAHVVAERHLGFHRVDVFPAFALCQGIPTDFLILSMREEDKAEAWNSAYERARRQVTSHNLVATQTPGS